MLIINTKQPTNLRNIHIRLVFQNYNLTQQGIKLKMNYLNKIFLNILIPKIIFISIIKSTKTTQIDKNKK